MTVDDILAAPFRWPPLMLTGALLVVSPGAHLVLSALVERRRVNLRDDYPAVLFGDPALAAGAGLALWLGAGALPPTVSWWGAAAATVVGVAYGWVQTRHELAEGRYTRAQALSPSKLFHQYIVYPVFGYICTSALWYGLADWRLAPVAAAAVFIATSLWALLVVDAVRHPRLGHGGWDWKTMSPRVHPVRRS